MRFPAPIIAILGLYVALSGCRTGSRGNLEGQSPPANNTTIVEAGCGTCVFHMDGVKGCPLAVRIDGQAYLVEGSDIDDHGDAHGPDGLCNVMRYADVTGKLINGKLKVPRFRLVGRR
jgi:hypothetical protein